MAGTITLHRFNGDEIYNVQSATIEHYKDEDGLFAVTFRADASSPAVQTLPDTAPLRRKPFAEVTLRLPKVPGLALRAGAIFALPQGGDDDVTDFYYCEHEPIDDVQLTVLERDRLRVRARITGTTTDVNHYDGSTPPTKLVIEADFALSL